MSEGLNTAFKAMHDHGLKEPLLANFLRDARGVVML